MKNIEVPAYLTPISAFTDPLEVIGEVREKKDRAGVQQRSTWNGLSGYVLPVEVIRGTKTKTLPSGKNMEILDTFRLNVTLWLATPQAVAIGDYVRLSSPLIGAVDGNLFVQAMGVEIYDPENTDDALSLMFDGIEE